MPHPDYLLGRDSLDNFHQRGLTPKQWKGWQTYLRFIPLPIDRIDFAFANLRAEQFAFHGTKAQAAKLIPPYGKVSIKLTEEELEEKAKRYFERRARRGEK